MIDLDDIVPGAVYRVSVEVTARSQRGSLSIYLGTILVTLVTLASYALLRVRLWPEIRVFDHWAQLLVAGVMITPAVPAAGSRGRVRGVLLVGVTGYVLALMFAMAGAPDLALTQVLVETVTLVVFVLVVRKLPRYFTNRPLSSTRWWRVLVAAAVGTTVAVGTPSVVSSVVESPGSVEVASPSAAGKHAGLSVWFQAHPSSPHTLPQPATQNSATVPTPAAHR